MSKIVMSRQFLTIISVENFDIEVYDNTYLECLWEDQVPDLLHQPHLTFLGGLNTGKGF